MVESTAFANVYDAGGAPLRVTLVDEPAAAGYTVLGWVVSDIAGTIAALVGRSVTFERFPGVDQDEGGVWTAPDGRQIAWFRDPDANILSLQQPSGLRSEQRKNAGSAEIGSIGATEDKLQG